MAILEATLTASAGSKKAITQSALTAEHGGIFKEF